MRHILVFVLALYSYTKAVSQSSQKLEIFPYYRHDVYPQFSYQLGDRPSVDYVNLKGSSWGIDVNYIIPIQSTLKLKIGTGYYRYSFNDIKKNNTQFGESTGRNINVYTDLFIPYFTDKYYYNSITGNVALLKDFKLSPSSFISSSIGIKNYFTFNRTYHLTRNPAGSDKFKTNRLNYFGTSAYIGIGYFQKFSRISIGPNLIIPVYDTWRTDNVFPNETSTDMRNKWFLGIGGGIACYLSLSKLK
jgi:hypothetical protein